MPTHPFFFAYGVFVVIFLVLYPLARPHRGLADRDLRHTPLAFATLLVCLLYDVYRETNAPSGSVFDRWVGYLVTAFIAGYLIRLYARLHARLRRTPPPNAARSAQSVSDTVQGKPLT